MTRVPSPASPHKDISAKTIFKAASQEIDQLQSLIESLQSVTPFHSQAESAIDGAEITAIQSLDYIAQSLFVLSNVLDEAGNHASREWGFKSLQSVQDSKLEALKNRFNGAEGASIAPMISGKCDFF